MTRTIRRARDPNFSTETIKAPAWRNILFEIGGASHLCEPVYSTEREAREAAELDLVEIRRRVAAGDGIWFAICHDGQQIMLADVSHCLQIPWTAERLPRHSPPQGGLPAASKATSSCPLRAARFPSKNP